MTFSLTMRCERCNSTRTELFKTFVESWQRFDDGNLSRPATLCGFCMVGNTVPAFRPFKNKWNLGQVEAFREDRSEFCVFFGGSDREWVHLEAAPFEAYVAYHREILASAEENQLHIQYGSCTEQSWPKNATTIFRDNCRTPPIPDEPPNHALLDLTPIEEKENTQAYDIFCDDALEPKHGPIQQPLFERNSMFDDSSEEEKPQKAGPRLWTIDEDQLLRRAILECSLPLKWPEVAKRVPGRSGKQCRERYCNHLRPSVKLAGWTPVEDSLLCHLHNSLGSKWAAISRLLPGRTDNSAKNRLHHIRRRLEKHAATLVSGDLDDGSLQAQLATMLKCENELTTVLVRVAANDIQAEKSPALCDYDFEFGPFGDAKEGESCLRCGFCMPSRQTGDKVCQLSGWCASCVETPAYMSGDLLRKHHYLRSSLETSTGPVSSMSSREKQGTASHHV